MSKENLIILNDEASETIPDKVKSEEITKQMRVSITTLKGRYMSEDGSCVDYKNLGRSAEFKAYCLLTSLLRYIDLAELNQNQLKCLFLNVYNSLTLHAMIHQSAEGKIPDSPKDVPGFWKIHCYNIGGSNYSLDDMEHGVLRNNKGHPSSKVAQFLEGDERRQYILISLDPRIHFALNCGASSCPPIRVYTPERVDIQLDAATKSFLSQEVKVLEENKVELSKLFLWYGQDFGENNLEIITWIQKALGSDIPELKTVLEATDNPNIVFKDYNWEANTNK